MRLDDDEYIISESSEIVSEIEIDDIVQKVSKSFDYDFSGVSKFSPTKLDIKFDYNIGLIVGPSGSGKSTTLHGFGQEPIIEWDSKKAICSHFESFDDACNKLNACGLSSIPQWVKPYHALSNGEQFRANIARSLYDGCVIDEFTSVVNRDVAKSISTSMSKYAKKNNIKNIVISSCHYDIIEYLQPDWVYDTQNKKFIRGSLWRPKIKIDLIPCSTKNWTRFAKFHYMNEEISKGANCWIAMWGDAIVGFTSIIPFPHGSIKRGWREHRTVVIPDFQGLGIGSRIGDAIGQYLINDGKQFYSKTANIKLISYRNNSKLWKLVADYETNSRERSNEASFKENGNMLTAEHIIKHASRDACTHKFVGSIEHRQKIVL
jgi:ABC-type lipoprotein export system ATPase subunit/GNAT superfamily N-acetyltransferase